MASSKVNLDGFSETELSDLIRSAEAELKKRADQRAKDALKEARRLAAAAGFTATFTKAGKPPGGQQQADSRRKVAAKYQNPDDPSETWAGRGRPPKWVEKALAAGGSLEDLAVSPKDAAA